MSQCIPCGSQYIAVGFLTFFFLQMLSHALKLLNVRRIKWTNIGNSHGNSDDDSKRIIRFGLQNCKKPSARRHATDSRPTLECY